MKTAILLLTLASLLSCGRSALKQKLLSADEVEVYFLSAEGNIVKTVRTGDGNAIKKLIQFVDRKETAVSNCDFDGKIVFLSARRPIQEIAFSYKQDSCRYFTFMIDMKPASTKLSFEAADFLQSLESGKGFY